MPAIRLFAALLLLPLAATASPEDAGDSKLIGGVLALMQQIVHLAAHSPDPAAAQKGVDAILAGENAQANRIASGVMKEIMQDVPPEHRGAVGSIGKDLLILMRREQARASTQTPAVPPDVAAPSNPPPAR